MRKSVWEMLGETLREASLVVLAVGLLDQIFSDSPITVNYAMMVLGVSGMIWVSGAWMEQARKE